MKNFYPVIHVKTSEQVNLNLSLAKNAGCDGVFLINHNVISEQSFIYLIDESVIKYQNDTFKVGVNFLSFDNLLALMMSVWVRNEMLWVDNANTDLEDLYLVNKFKKTFDKLPNPPKYFGGVQFKYQPKPNWDLTTSIERALPWVDVVTLSGPATGVAAEVKKIKDACQTYNSNRFALASGISEENVELFLPYVDNFLVATSIIDENEVFVPQKLNNLERKIHEFR